MTPRPSLQRSLRLRRPQSAIPSTEDKWHSDESRDLGAQFSSGSLDNPSESAHCAVVRRDLLTRVILGKPILSEQGPSCSSAQSTSTARAQSSWT